MSQLPPKPLPIIGYLEQVDLPEWGVFGLVAKIDTGALTSALHVENLARWDGGWLTFDVPNPLAPERGVQHVEARVQRKSEVRATSGITQERLVVVTQLRLGAQNCDIELGLVDRSQMNYPMLLGREALAGRYLVDAALSYALS